MSRAELEKVARLLGVEGADLGFLDGLPSADVRAFREQVTD
ncbi:hypothetical protein ACFWBF_32000 [Streptomyces sp. NPDC060028]